MHTQQIPMGTGGCSCSQPRPARILAAFLVLTFLSSQGQFQMLKDWQRQPSPKRIKHDNATLAEIDFARRDDGCDLTHLLESFNPDELPISCKNFPDIKIDNQSILGAGYWRKTVSGSWNGQRVAVKYVVKEDTCSKRDDCLMRPIMEAAIHQLLQGTGRFLPILGMCGSTLVFPQLSPISKKDFPLSTRTALRYSLEFAQALAHLQESPAGPMSHNDLKLEHMLLDGNGHIRLFDFHWLKYNGVPRRRAGTASDDKRCGHNGQCLHAVVAAYSAPFRHLEAFLCLLFLFHASHAPPNRPLLKFQVCFPSPLPAC